MIAGKYRVERILGEGGMGVVVLARHLGLDESVAIKVLRPEAVRDEEAVARLLREARATVRIKNEHVARVLDVGAMENGSPYIVMEHLEGHDLDKVLGVRQQLPVERAIDYVIQACEALAAAHALGIVHRDIKPSNLFVTMRADGTECLKVLDFGISKATSPLDATKPEANITRTHSVIGTPQYMAPEQMRSQREADSRTDVWGLGTLLYELLAGTPPFIADTVPELCAMILRDPTPPLRAKRPDVPEELAAIIHRCLDKSPAARFASAAELAFAIAPFGGAIAESSGLRIARTTTRITPQAFPVGGRPSIPDNDKTLPMPSSQAMMDPAVTTVDRPSRSVLPLVAGGIAFVLFTSGAVMGAYALVGRSRPTPPAPEPPRAVAQAPVEAPIASTTPEPTAEPAPAPSATASTRHTAPHPITARPSARPSASAAPAPHPSNPPGLATSRYD